MRGEKRVGLDKELEMIDRDPKIEISFVHSISKKGMDLSLRLRLVAQLEKPS